MFHKALAASALFAAAAVVACSTFGGSEDDPGGGGDDGGGPDTTSATDGGGTTDGDAGTCDLAVPQGTFYRASFDNGGNCEGWSVANGTIDPVLSPSRCGAGSCKVCASGPGYTTLSRELPFDKAGGTVELRFEVRSDNMTGALQGLVSVKNEAGVELAATWNNVPLDQGQWTSGQVIAPYAGAAGSVGVRVTGLPDAGGLCYYVDEIRLGHY